MSAVDPSGSLLSGRSGDGFLTALANALAIFSSDDCDLATMLLPEGLPISCQTAYR